MTCPFLDPETVVFSPLTYQNAFVLEVDPLEKCLCLSLADQKVSYLGLLLWRLPGLYWLPCRTLICL